MIILDYKLRNQFTIIIFMMVCLIILIITKKIMIEDWRSYVSIEKSNLNMYYCYQNKLNSFIQSIQS